MMKYNEYGKISECMECKMHSNVKKYGEQTAAEFRTYLSFLLFWFLFFWSLTEPVLCYRCTQCISVNKSLFSIQGIK